MNDNEREFRICRICFDDESELKKLIAPCKCRGTAKYIHEECLNFWINEQVRTNVEANCEVCKYKFQFEVNTKIKCNPKDSISENPFRLCYFFISLMMLSIVFILLYVVIERRYIDSNSNVGYFIGVLVLFLLIILCLVGIILKLLKGICYVKSREQYRVQPYKSDQIDLNNTTNMLNSLQRNDSVENED